jgi:hypothetical protein
MIHIIRSQATAQQIADMLEALNDYIKLAVDVQRGILAGGGAMHADCESMLLEDGSYRRMCGAPIGILLLSRLPMNHSSTFVRARTIVRWK